MYFSVLTNIIVIITVHLVQFWLLLKNLGTLHNNALWNGCDIVSLSLYAVREDTLTHC